MMTNLEIVRHMKQKPNRRYADAMAWYRQRSNDSIFEAIRNLRKQGKIPPLDVATTHEIAACFGLVASKDGDELFLK